MYRSHQWSACVTLKGWEGETIVGGKSEERLAEVGGQGGRLKEGRAVDRAVTLPLSGLSTGAWYQQYKSNDTFIYNVKSEAST